jgi:hypothetical protein
MLTQKQLTNTEIKEIAEKLEAIADVLFESGRTFSGNQLQEIVYHLEAHLDEAAEA